MIYINRAALKAVLYFAASEDVRYYLKGVLVEATPTETRLVATSGHALAVHRTERPEGALNCANVRVILPYAVVESRTKTRASLPDLELTVEQEHRDGELHATLNDNGEQHTFALVNGTFPRYQSVIPQKISGQLAQFDPQYLMACSRARTALLGKKTKPFTHVHHNGDSAAVVDIDVPEFFAVVMPTRSHNKSCSIPAWLADGARK